MVSVWKKLCVMLWKCLILRKRNWRMTSLELLSPLFVAFAAYRLNILGRELVEKERPDPSSNFVLFPLQTISNIPIVTEHVAYTPINQETSDIMEDFRSSVEDQVVHNITRISSCQIEPLPNMTSLQDWLREKCVNNILAMGIIFYEINRTNHVFRYTLKSNSHELITYKLIDPDLINLMYENSSFLSVQTLVDKAFLKYSGVSYNGDKIILGKLPLFFDDYTMAIFFLYLFIMCAYAVLVASITRDVLQEKCTGITELMKIMGISSWMMWTHWFIYTLVVYLPATVGMTIFLAGISPRVIRVDVLVLWLLLFLFSVDCIAILFAVSCLFHNPVRGSITCITFWFVIHFSTLYYVNKPDELNFVFQIVMCLIPLHNLCWTIHSLSSFSKNYVTWTLAYTFSKGYTGSQISLGLSLIIFISQTLVAIIALAFLNTMYPGPYGIGKPITCICKSCFKNISSKVRISESSSYMGGSNSSRFEPPPPGTKVGIKVRGLHKKYGWLKKVVSVDNVDLDIYEGEIMALLGHNGAGKTSTMAMITGMLTPTEGLITANDINIHDDLSNFRKSLGLCTQHNMYFHQLTVIEHLIFFGMIKGASYSTAKKRGLQLLSLLNMVEKAKSKADKLSGGMQRRLCLAMSLVEKPKVLVLDEPTSGLDPENRRYIWDVILSFRGSRTILITTHFMEEADVLGDRIAIMDRGKIVCCGSTMFLKKIYGAGYNIRILKNEKSTANEIVSFFETNLPSITAKVVSPNQLEFAVKDDYVRIFPSLFQKLESDKKKLGIVSVSIACTTLEDVFLKVAEKELVNECISEEEQSKIKLDQQRTVSRHCDYKKSEGFFWTVTCFQMLVWKRFLYRKRNYCSLLIKILLCTLILCLMVYEPSEGYLEYSHKSLNITLGMYPNSVNPMVFDTNHEALADTAIDLVKRNNGTVLTLLDSDSLRKYALELIRNDPTYYTHRTLLAFAFLDEKFVVAYQPRFRIHLPAVAANLIANILLINSTAEKSGIIETGNNPYRMIKGDKCNKYDFYRMSCPLFWLVYMSFVLTIFMVDFLPFTVEERCSGFKHQQIISGLSPVVYWVSTFVSDLIVYFLMVLLILSLVLLFGWNVVVVSSTGFHLFSLVLVLHGVSGLTSVYLFSFFIDNSSLSSGAFIMCNIMFGLIPAFIVYLDIVTNFTVFLTIVTMFSFIPNFCATLSFGFIAAAMYDLHLCKLCGQSFCEDAKNTLLKFPVDEDRTGILVYILFLSCTWVVYVVMVILIEWNSVRKMIFECRKHIALPPPETEDSDVKREKERVKLLVAAEDTECPLKVDNLVKKYMWGPIAVKRVNFVVERGDCFGLLGVNGAGKTTTLKMITGEIMPNHGDAIAIKHSLAKNRRKYLSSIGYCPQSDPLLDTLNARDTLKVIATIRRIPQDHLQEEVEFWLDVLGITEHSKKPTYTYSGGTKRKLSTAMAFIGNPVVVFLDEPTTGVDPVSRRKLWSLVQARQKAGQAVLLTSHSMEECEALCTRLTIMKDGEMRCIGTAEYLKNRFGQGYTVLIKLINPTDTDLFKLKQDFQELFPNSFVKDEHYTWLHYHISDSKILLSDLFSSVLRLSERYAIIEDFHASNTTLEHLFLAFAEDREMESRSTRRSTL